MTTAPNPAILGAGVLLTAGLAYWLSRPGRDLAETGPGVNVAFPGFNLANLAEETMPSSSTDNATATANLAAFLVTIRHAEGTAGPNGYRTLFGGELFASYADHPRTPRRFTDRAGRELWTSAAGAYQLLAVSPLPGGGATRMDTWDRLQQRLQLPDFGPASQDAAAVALIDEAGALRDAQAGRFAVAVRKCRRTWASLPDAGYAQPERSLDWLAQRYSAAGGLFA